MPQEVQPSLRALEHASLIAVAFSVIREVRIRFKGYNAVRSLGDVISSILNCVCPECGGRLGEPGKEFKCLGECRTDWREVWDRALSVRSTHDAGGRTNCVHLIKRK
jgi:tRNA(Ile2) C34 agmatinyltransferase TiaS